ncbi:MAG TPA: CotH kinase family protein [Polyangiales bacterium]|nr:CotH kinase family protein [Polyangiales bacterium]
MPEPLDTAHYLFDPKRVHVFELEIAPLDLERVDRDPKTEEYVPARLHFEGTSIDVGYRYKGSVGGFRPPCTAEFDGGPKNGKCSIKLSINWKDPDAQFFGLKKLLFHAMNKDESQLRERLGYGLFRTMGVPAPRAVHAVLKVNGHAELYALVEEIDGRFTRSRFSEGGKGNLYKEIWPIHDDPSVYEAALETNEDQSPSVERMLEFRAAVQAGPAQMARWLDQDVTVSYMAVDRLILNDDGAFHFYCIEGGMGNNPTLPANHNYYWYEAELTDRVWLIPWDLDQSLRDIDYPPHIPHDWRVQPPAAECGMCGRGTGLALNGHAPGCDPVIRNFQAWQTLYESKLDELIAGPFSKAAVDAQLDVWLQQIERAGFPVNKTAVAELQAILERARANRGYPY